MRPAPPGLPYYAKCAPYLPSPPPIYKIEFYLNFFAKGILKLGNSLATQVIKFVQCNQFSLPSLARFWLHVQLNIFLSNVTNSFRILHEFIACTVAGCQCLFKQITLFGTRFFL